MNEAEDVESSNARAFTEELSGASIMTSQVMSSELDESPIVA